MQQRAEIADGIAAQRHVLAIHQRIRPHLLLTGDEVVVPEERHALGERRGRGQHLAIPPGAQLDRLFDLIAPVRRARLLAHLLQIARAHDRFVDQRRRRRARCGKRSGQQPVRGLGAGERRVLMDLGVARGEPGAVQEMARIVVTEQRVVLRGVQVAAGQKEWYAGDEESSQRRDHHGVSG